MLPSERRRLKDSCPCRALGGAANGGGDILLAFGRMGQEFATRTAPRLSAMVVMSLNFVGFMLDHAVADGATSIVLAGRSVRC